MNTSLFTDKGENLVSRTLRPAYRNETTPFLATYLLNPYQECRHGGNHSNIAERTPGSSTKNNMLVLTS